MNHHASMNRIYRLIWSEVRSAWVPVAETARGRGKSGRGRSGRARSIASRNLVAAAISLALAPLAHAASPPAHAAPPCGAPVCGPTALSATSHPLGGKVVSGSASISQVGNTTDIRQSSADVAIDWLSFSVGSEESVDFLQPSASAVAVNRITGSNGSEILGHLEANGQVYLINPNGIIFGKGAEVNVGGLVASTLDVNESSVSGSSRSFEGSGTGSIVNEGTISAANGGYVALIGNRVSNEGVIRAQLGTVVLGAGNAVTLDFSGDRLVHLEVDQSTLNNLAENQQLIEADGGLVIMTAAAQRALLASVVNNTGVIEARTVENHEGTIELLGGMSAGTVKVSGTLDASAPQGGNGGTIETDAAHVEVANAAKVTTAASNGLTGSWLIDPEDFTVAATGGDITGATLSKELGSTSITLESSAGTKAPSGSGNVNIDDAVSWSANTSLTLTAANDVNVNENITATGSTAALLIKPNTANGTESASGTGTFDLRAGASITLSGADASLSIATPSYTLGTGAQINLANVSPTSTTALTIGGIDYTVINSLGAAGSTTGTDLQGIDGKPAGHYALGSNIDAAATATWNSNGAATPVYAGFTPIGTQATPFTGTFEGLGHTISALTIDRPMTSDVGLIGKSGKGAVIRDVGLIGGSVSGAGYVGALVGLSGGTVSNSYATGSVAGTSYVVGGLVGQNNGAVSDSYATGRVAGSGTVVGGLVGQNNNGAVSNSYATGSVTGSSAEVGGLVGQNNIGAVSDSYATGKVSGDIDVGGLVGYNIGSGSTISTSYAKGGVSGSGIYVGGLVGHSTGSVIGSYWDETSSGQSTSAGGTGLTTAQMQTAADLPGFSFTTTAGASGNNWVLVDLNGSLNNAGGAPGATFPMLASEYTTRIDNAHQLQLMAMNTAAAYFLSQDIDASTTGTSTDVWGSSGFIPIGDTNTAFTGALDGLGHTISGLTINLPSSNFVGLIGLASPGSVIEEIGLVGGSISGSSYVGGLVGKNQGAVSYSSATDAVSGSGNFVGGLVGFNSGTLSESFAAGNVSGTGNQVSGLVGYNSATGTISESGATGNVTSTANAVGGLVGTNAGTVGQSYATGSVSGDIDVGGLFGVNTGTVSASYASSPVTGSMVVGGLMGYNSSTVKDSYATGNVSGVDEVGGLVGYNTGARAAIGLTYAAGKVSGSGSDVGGLVGVNTGNIAASYWDVTTSGQSASITGATGLTTAQMQSAANFAGFNFTSTPGASGNNWVLVDIDGSLNNAGAAPGATFPMLASEYSTTINNTHQLQLMEMNLTATYTLGQNIDASATGTSADVWGSLGFIPIGSTSAAFTGTLDGLGHTVGGLTINIYGSNAGLIGVAGKGSVIEEVGLLGGSVTGSSYVGTLVGRDQGTVSDSYATGFYVNGSDYVGGLEGYNSGNITSSYATSSVSGAPSAGSKYFGGLVGYNSGNITSSYAAREADGGTDVGGLVGYNSAKGSISDSHATGGADSSFPSGLAVGGLIGENAGAVNDGYATGNVGGYADVGGLIGKNEGTISTSYASGQVTAFIGPDLVENVFVGVYGGATAGGLAGINSGTVTGSYATGAVTGLVDLGGLLGVNSGTVANCHATGSVSTTNYFDGNSIGQYATTAGGLAGNNAGSVAGSFATGNVSGQGAVGGLVGNGGGINNSYATGNVSGSNDVGGLVGGVGSGGGISSSYATGNVTGANYVGGLAGSSSSISSSHATGSVTGSGNFVGGLVGSGGSINSSYATGKVTGANYVGGLAGYANNAIAYSYAKGNASGANDVGGLVGYVVAASVTNSYAIGSVSGMSEVGGLIGVNDYKSMMSSDHAAGAVSGTANDVGGLVGLNSGTVSGSYGTGSVSGASYVGGLVGYNVSNSGSSPAISTSHATGVVSGTGNYVGGLVGYNSVGTTVSSDYATGKVTGASYAGGLVGYNTGTLNISYATGNVTGTKNVGGLVGDNVSSVANTYATGGVNGSSYVGGLVGYNTGTLSISYATGNVTGTKNVGGLVGDNFSSVANTYATGGVNGSSNVGGLVGINTGTVSTSYSTGSVSGSSEVGGLVGNTAGGGTVSASFWNVPTSGQTTSSGGTGLTTTQMENQANFTSATPANGEINPGWNFTSIWYLPVGKFPMLQAFESTQ
jgi:filamentous hemagglutinin family protein